LFKYPSHQHCQQFCIVMIDVSQINIENSSLLEFFLSKSWSKEFLSSSEKLPTFYFLTALLVGM